MHRVDPFASLMCLLQPAEVIAAAAEDLLQHTQLVAGEACLQTLNGKIERMKNDVDIATVHLTLPQSA